MHAAQALSFYYPLKYLIIQTKPLPNEYFLHAEVRGGYWEGMACVNCLRRNPPRLFVCYMAIDDTPFCCWNDLDNSDSLQCPCDICYNVLLHKRSDIYFTEMLF